MRVLLPIALMALAACATTSNRPPSARHEMIVAEETARAEGSGGGFPTLPPLQLVVFGQSQPAPEHDHVGQLVTAAAFNSTETSGSGYGVTLNGARLGFIGAGSQTFAIGSASAVSIYVSGSEVGAFTSQGVTSVGTGRYLQTSGNGAGAPTAADCDSAGERGKLYIETTNNRLYVCNGATRLWDFVALTD